ncbi:hypothetical protein EG68_10029 [Paragonimus skrjabini miyazakii]|uniref:Uncharacterized protein n=1 Tax=Paragonimus skrjabini miyazakii TaxID=59628 RepID=A0A8S9YEJ9_9TREM|nr:hypothetical protein EG68_10029 [Paragonimus skrjabini miyazakii]
MTAAPCLPSATSGMHLGKFQFPASLSSAPMPSSLPPLFVSSPVETSALSHTQLLELLQNLVILPSTELQTSSSVASLAYDRNPEKLLPVLEASKSSDPLPLQLAKFQVWLTNTARPTTPVTSTSVSGLVSCPPVRTHCLTGVNLTAADPGRSNPIKDNHGIEQQMPSNVGHRVSPEKPLQPHPPNPDSGQRMASTNPTTLLHQLLSGVDFTQVRNRSGLIEPNLTASGRHELSNGDLSGCVSSTQRTSDHTNAVDLTMEPDDSTAVHQASILSSDMSSALTPTQNSSTESLLSTKSSTVDQSIPPLLSEGGSLTPFLERILAFLLELQKTSGNSASLSTSVADQPQLATAGPVSIPTEPALTQGVPIASSYPNCLLQLLTGNVTHSSLRSSPVKCVPSVQHPASPSTPLKVCTFNINDRQNCETPGPLVTSSEPAACCSPQSSHVNRDSQYRPRSYSDLHQGTRYHHKLQRSQYRPRSNSKIEKPVKVVRGLIETEKLTRELESSLFAQLVLNADSPPPVLATTMEVEPIPDHPTEPYVPDAPLADAGKSSVSTELDESLVAQSNSGLKCIASDRHRVMELLREADLFVAEHSYDIPLGALLAVAITPGHYGVLAELCSVVLAPSSFTEVIPSSARRVVSKTWHQLLLLLMIENNFIPHVSSSPTEPSNANSWGINVQKNQSNDAWRNRTDFNHSTREKLLNAISSLAALETDDCPAPDIHLVNDLTDLVMTGHELQLEAGLFKSMRFCVLAQNAYPHHFSTSYTEALSELEAELSRCGFGSATFADVLKLLNRLHCFDASTLKQFFGLAIDPLPLSERSPVNNKILGHTTSSSPAPSSVTPVTEHSTSGTFKRKARCAAPTVRDSDQLDHSPVRMRSRAYTTNSYNKSARLTELKVGRTRSDTAPVELRSGTTWKAFPR